MRAPTAQLDTIRTEGDTGTTPSYRAFVAGKWVESLDGQWIDVTNPADDTLIARVPALTRADAERALDSAAGARRAIRDLPATRRIEILEEASSILEDNRGFLTDLVVAESGKPITVARGEVKATIERLRLTGQEARTLHGDYIPGDWVHDTTGKIAIVRRQPRGVIAAITPFNYPLFIAAAKVTPALIAGNTVIVKPSTEAPLSMLFFARALEAAGLPPAALHILTGRGREIGDTIANSPHVDMISFTGSTLVGEHIANLASMKHLALELGGKGAALILNDANLDLAARETARGALRFQGQRCDAIGRILVDRTIADEYVERLVAEVKSNYPMGDPREETTAIGPLIHKRAATYAQELIEDATAKGARILLGGNTEGNYVEPTILDDVTTNMRIAWEEAFAPIIPIMRIQTIDEMLDIANRSQYGLDSSIFTNDINKAWGIATRLDDGAVTINGYPAHGVGHFPFGGNKKSGMGREGIGASIEEMTRPQTIVLNLPPMQTPFTW